MDYAGFSADEPLSYSKTPVINEDTAQKQADDSPPLKSCVGQVIEIPDVLGIAPDDFQLFYCADAEEPLRVLLNPTDGWVYPVFPTSYPAKFPLSMTEFEYEIENFRNAFKISVRPRLVPFIRFTANKNANCDFWTSFIEAFETLIEFGAIRDQDEARGFLDNLGNIPSQRAGRRCNHNIVFDKPMILDDCTTQDLAISPLCFTVVDYCDLIPLSEELQRILGCTQRTGEINAPCYTLLPH